MSCYQNSKNNLTQTCTEQDQSRRKGAEIFWEVFASLREKLFCHQCFMSFASPCFWVTLIVLILIATSCQVLPEPPRLATATAQAALPPSPRPEPLIIPVNGETAVTAPNQTPPDGQPNPSLTVWINETSPAHKEAVGKMAADFTEKNNVNVELVFIAPNVLPDLVETAAENGSLPDIILHPIEYTIGWAEQGILNPDVAETAVNNLGASTFNQAALELVSINGKPAAVPSDGYQQLVLFRSDWFGERNLGIPDNYNDMLAAAEAIYDRENLRSGFVIPTESNLRTTHQAFEHIAAANGCELINEAGEVLITEPACKEALDFYYDIVHQFSPIGVQTDTSTRNAYLEGRTGMIMTPPTILPQLAGLDENNVPSCAECDRNTKHLAENSGIITTIFGRGGTSANFGEMTNLGITNEADPETAVLFTDYWFNDGYETWLAVESERKVPLRQGTSTNPTQYLDNWGQQPLAGSDQNLTDLFGEEVVAQLRDGVAESNRWGIPQGQGALVTDLYRELSLSVVLQEMLSGYFNTDKTIYEAYQRVLEFIPNYAFEVVVEPSPTPELEE
jgi:multiple sugar transport system substrate-binding protein